MGIQVSALSANDGGAFSKTKSPASSPPSSPISCASGGGALFIPQVTIPSSSKKPTNPNSTQTPVMLGNANGGIMVSSNDLNSNPSFNSNNSSMYGSNNSSSNANSPNSPNSNSQRRRYSSQLSSMKGQKMMDPENINMLMLGAGEVGKSTLFRQLKYVCEGPAVRTQSIHDMDPTYFYSQNEIEDYKEVIRENVMQNMRWLLEGCEDLGIQIAREELRARAQDLISKLAEQSIQNVIMTPENEIKSEMAPLLEDLWKDEGVQQAFERKNEFHIYETASYFLENVKRIFDNNYVPTLKDILTMREKTIGIQELKYRVEDRCNMCLTDLGGQRLERKKWIHQFNSADLVVFVVSLSEFNLTCYEDGETPRHKESFDIFQDLIHNPNFHKIPFVLLFNKLDLLESKIASCSFSSHFKDEFPPEKDEKNVHDCVQFLQDKYSQVALKSRNVHAPSGMISANSGGEDAPVLIRVLSAMNEENVSSVFKDVTEFAIREHNQRYLTWLTNAYNSQK